MLIIIFYFASQELCCLMQFNRIKMFVMLHCIIDLACCMDVANKPVDYQACIP